MLKEAGKNTAPRPLTEPRDLDSRRSARPNGRSALHAPRGCTQNPQKSRRVGIWLRSQETLQVAPGSREPQRPTHNLAKTCATVTGDVSAETLLRRAETALGGAPLVSSPPPHLQPASGRPPAPGPLAPRAAVSSRPPPADWGGRRARRGGPSPSGRGGSSQQQQPRRPLTWKVTAEKEEEEEDGEKEEEEEGEEEGEETPLVPLFSLPRRPLLAKAERVWWGVSGSISLRTEGGRVRREGSDPDRLPRLLFPFIYFSDTVRRWARGRGHRARAGAARPGPQPSACGSRSGRLPSRSVDAPGYSWQRLPEQKLLGGVRGQGGRGGGGEAGGGREEEGETQPATSSDPPARPREGG